MPAQRANERVSLPRGGRPGRGPVRAGDERPVADCGHQWRWASRAGVRRGAAAMTREEARQLAIQAASTNRQKRLAAYTTMPHEPRTVAELPRPPAVTPPT